MTTRPTAATTPTVATSHDAGTEPAGSEGTTGRNPGRHHPGRREEAGRPARPRRRCRTSARTASSPSASSSSPRSATARCRQASGQASPSRGSRTRTAASGRSTCVRASSGTTAPTSRRPTWPPRWTAWLLPPTPACNGVIERGLGRLIRSDQSRVHTARAERQLPVPRLGLQRTGGHHAGRVRERTTLDATPNGTGPFEAQELRRGNRRRVRAQRRLVGRHDPARRQRVELLRRRGLDGDGCFGGRGRRARASSRPSVAPRCSTTRTSTSSRSRPPPTARSGCAATPGSSPTPGSAGRSGCASTVRRSSTRCSRARPTSATTT